MNDGAARRTGWETATEDALGATFSVLVETQAGSLRERGRRWPGLEIRLKRMRREIRHRVLARREAGRV